MNNSVSKSNIKINLCVPDYNITTAFKIALVKMGLLYWLKRRLFYQFFVRIMRDH